MTHRSTVPRRFRPAGLALAALFFSVSASPAVGGAPAVGPGPGAYELDSTGGTARIPFEVYRDDIRMIAEVNGREARMLIDNGVLWDDLLFFGSPRVDSLGLARDGQVLVGGAGEGELASSDYATGVTVRFPGVTFRDQNAVITPYTPGEPNPWEGAEGQVSAAFLKHFVVDIDFDAGFLTLIEPDRFRYEGGGVELPLLPRGPGVFAIPARIDLPDGRRLDVELTLDLGGVDPLDLDVGGPHRVTPPEDAAERVLGYGVQGPIRGRYGRVPRVEIGGYELRDVTAGFRSPSSAGTLEDQDEFMIGFPLLARFHIVFDYPGGRMFVEPNRSFGDPFEIRESAAP